MGTYSSPILPNSSGLDLGSPSQRWDAFLKDLNISGTLTLPSQFVTVTFSVNPNFDGSSGLSTAFSLTLSGNVTASTVSNLSAGGLYTFVLIQDGTGGRTFQWPAGTLGAMVVDPAANAVSIQTFVYNGSVLEATASGVSGVVTRPGGTFSSNAGVFTATQQNLFNQFLLNSIDPAAEWAVGFGGSLHATEALTAGVAVPVGSTVFQSSAIAGYANNLSGATTAAVGVYGQSNALSANSQTLASNFIASDTAGNATTTLYATELDININNVGTVATGCLVHGSFAAQPTASKAIEIAQPNGGSRYWPEGIRFNTGATLAASLSNLATGLAIDFNPAGSGTNQGSQGIGFIANDPVSGQNLAVIGEDANGNVFINSGKAGSGLKLSGPITQYNSLNTVAAGTAAIYATVGLTARTAATGGTLYAVPASRAGQYRVSWNSRVTTAAGVSSTLGPFTLQWTDPDGTVITTTGQAAQGSAGTIAQTNATNATNSTGILLGLPVILNCKDSTNIVWAMAYASNAANAMNYNINIMLEYLG